MEESLIAAACTARKDEMNVGKNGSCCHTIRACSFFKKAKNFSLIINTVCLTWVRDKKQVESLTRKVVSKEKSC